MDAAQVMFCARIADRRHAGSGSGAKGCGVDLTVTFVRWSQDVVRSEGTVKRYRRGVRALVARGLVNVEDVTRAGLVRYADERRSEGVGARTINGDFAGALAVLRWLVKRGELPVERLTDARAARLDEPRPLSPDAYSEDDYWTVLGAIKHPLVRLAFRVACLSGLRISELRRLRREDFDCERKVLRVRGPTKNHRERVVSTCAELVELVAPLGEGPLFPALRRREPQRDPHVSLSFLEVNLTTDAFRAGVQAGFHKCRRTFVTRALLAGVPPSEVARMAGHDIKVMISRYAAWIDRYEPAIEGLSHRPPAAGCA